MPTFAINPSDLGKSLTDDHRRMLEVSVRAIQDAVSLHGPRIAQATVNSISPPPVDRGTYRRSFKAQKVANGAVFYNFAPHAPIVEMGRRPGAKMPPVDVLVAWVKRKKIGLASGPQPRGGKGKRLSRRLSDSQARGIAFMIARSIGRRGLPAHHVLAITEQVLTPIVEKAIDDALGKV